MPLRIAVVPKAGFSAGGLRVADDTSCAKWGKRADRELVEDAAWNSHGVLGNGKVCKDPQP